MSVEYRCDVCGNSIGEQEPLQKFVLFRGKHSLNRSIVYRIDERDYCRTCAEKDAEPHRRKRGRKAKTMEAINAGYATQVTLPSGRYMYVGTGSALEQVAKNQGLTTKLVGYFGACIYCNINERAHDNFPIEIDEVSVAEFIDKIATEEECIGFAQNAYRE